MKRRTLFLALATLSLLCALGIELGQGLLLSKPPVTEAEMRVMIERETQGEEDVDQDEMLREMKRLNGKAEAPGLAIHTHALIDAWLFFTFVTWLLADLISQSLVAKIQGPVTILLALGLLLAGILVLLSAFGLLMLMVGLFLAPPFGTLAYLAGFGFFDRAGASVSLSLIMGFKVAAIVLGFLAARTLLSNKSLITLLLFSLLATLLTSCLHGLVPGVLVSIVDAIAAIVIAVLGLIWALFSLIGAILSLISALRSAVA